MKRQFPNTKAALVEYDAGVLARDKAWKDVDSNEAADAAEAADNAALAKVQDAFHLDTQDINSRDNCALVDLDFMRKMAKVGDE